MSVQSALECSFASRNNRMSHCSPRGLFVSLGHPSMLTSYDAREQVRTTKFHLQPSLSFIV